MCLSVDSRSEGFSSEQEKRTESLSVSVSRLNGDGADPGLVLHTVVMATVAQEAFGHWFLGLVPVLCGTFYL